MSNSAPSTPTRIGAVAYLNTRPLVHGMEQGLGKDRIELSYDVPSRLADRMQQGELDIALMPVIEFAKLPDLEIVPGLGIVTFGQARSVLLISNGDPAALNDVSRLALDPESRTSNALAQVLLAERWKRSDLSVCTGTADLAATLQHCDAAVRIGDKALFDAPPPGTTVTDLGQAWTDLTALPFVFAAWFARPGVMDRSLYQILHASRRQGVKAIDQIAADYVWQGRHDPELAKSYLTVNIRSRLGAAEVQALSLFLSLATTHGVIANAPRVRFSFERHTDCHDAADARRTAAVTLSDEAPHA